MISSTIDALSDDTTSLTTPLLKVKVLASRIGNKELLEWVNNELVGYKTDESLPEYRKARATPKGNLQQGAHYERNVTLPIMIFGEKIAKELVEYPVYQGIKGIEQLTSDLKGDTLVQSYGADYCAFLTKAAKDNDQWVRITHAWIEVHISELVQVLSAVRNKLLDLLLKVEEDYPNLEEDLKANTIDKSEVNQTIIHIMNNFNTSGDGNIINTGNKNTFNTKINVSKGNVNELRSVLREASVPEENIIEIENIVVQEEPNLEKKSFGEKTNQWIQKMVGKTLDKSWDVATGSAAGLLTETLKSFYGL